MRTNDANTLTIKDLAALLELDKHTSLRIFKYGNKWHALAEQFDGAGKRVGVGDTFAAAVLALLEDLALRRPKTQVQQ